MMIKTKTYKGIKVFYTDDINGGGDTFGQDFIPLIESKFNKVNTLCEFASGSGFIGFSLLANGLCNNLVLIDVNPEAIELCKKTIKYNHLEKKVKVYLSNGLKDIPAREKYDMIVSNPPHFNRPELNEVTLREYDFNWYVHRQFYRYAKAHLTRSGVILFQENATASNPNTFKGMIEDGGLKIRDNIKPNRKMRISRYINAVKNYPIGEFIWSAFTVILLERSYTKEDYTFYFLEVVKDKQ